MSKRNSLLEISDKLTLKVSINSLIKDLEQIKVKCEELLVDENATEEDKRGCEAILSKYDDHIEHLKEQHENVYLLSGEDHLKNAVLQFSDTSQEISDLITENLGVNHGSEEDTDRLP